MRPIAVGSRVRLVVPPDLGTVGLITATTDERHPHSVRVCVETGPDAGNLYDWPTAHVEPFDAMAELARITAERDEAIAALERHKTQTGDVVAACAEFQERMFAMHSAAKEPPGTDAFETAKRAMMGGLFDLLHKVEPMAASQRREWQAVALEEAAEDECTIGMTEDYEIAALLRKRAADLRAGK